jgi:hypothetical protein
MLCVAQSARTLDSASAVCCSCTFFISHFRVCLQCTARLLQQILAVCILTTEFGQVGAGIIAYELLTHEPVFGHHARQADVFDQLCGRKLLPWEDPERKDAGFRKLRMLKRSLIMCLSRDPSARPSASDLLAMWEALFDSFGTDAAYVLPSEADPADIADT